MKLIEILLFLLLTLPPPRPVIKPEVKLIVKSAVTQASDPLAELINIKRRELGFYPYLEDKRLLMSAYNKACDMRDKNYFSHEGYVRFILNTGYNRFPIGENLGEGWTSDSRILEAWMNSPAHKANILSGKYKNIGVGRCGDYWVLHFGS